MVRYIDNLKAILRGETQLDLPASATAGHSHGTATSFSSTRRAEHRGRKISVRTTYRIEIDGEPVRAHTMVMENGQVMCHGLPNYSFTSALDLARALVDGGLRAEIPEDEIGGDGVGDGGHDDHGGHHGHGGGHQG